MTSTSWKHRRSLLRLFTTYNTGLSISKGRASIIIDFSQRFSHDDVASASQGFLFITARLEGWDRAKRMVGACFKDQRIFLLVCMAGLASRQNTAHMRSFA